MPLGQECKLGGIVVTQGVQFLGERVLRGGDEAGGLGFQIPARRCGLAGIARGGVARCLVVDQAAQGVVGAGAFADLASHRLEIQPPGRLNDGGVGGQDNFAGRPEGDERRGV